jgi:GntR family transcriptional regulator
VIPTEAEHDLLGLRPPSAVFSVERTGTSSGVPIEWRHTLLRADRFALTSTLGARPGAAGRPGGDASASALTPSFG